MRGLEYTKKIGRLLGSLYWAVIRICWSAHARRLRSAKTSSFAYVKRVTLQVIIRGFAHPDIHLGESH